MQNRESAILLYGALSVEEMSGVGPARLDEIQTEKRRIERELGLSPKEIIVEASRLTSR
ncbi:MAG: hypothetical protein ACYC1K_01315 [Minisyncoccota bacterium]